MRKIIFITMVIAFSIPLLGYSQLQKDGIALNSFAKTTIFNQSLNLKSEQVLGQIIYLPEETFNQREAAAIISRIDQIPYPILTKINREGIQVKLFQGKLTDNPSARHLKGVIPRGYTSNKTWDDVPGIGGSKTVLVKIGASEKGNGHGSVNLELHELAHSVDRYVYDEIRNKPEFVEIWELERGKLFPGQSYFIDYPEEYFAEAFAMYYLGGETRQLLNTKAPKTFAFIGSLY